MNLKEWLRSTKTPYPGLIRIAVGIAFMVLASVKYDEIGSPAFYILGVVIFVIGIWKMVKWLER